MVGLLHRDVKCDNILMYDGDEDDGDYRYKLSDLGLSVKADAAVRNRAGTVGWMDPEVELGAPPSTAADIWSLGATMVELLVRSTPFGFMDGLRMASAQRSPLTSASGARRRPCSWTTPTAHMPAS